MLLLDRLRAAGDDAQHRLGDRARARRGRHRRWWRRRPAVAALCASHLTDREGGADDMRRNIDTWWPLVEGGARSDRDERLGLRRDGQGIRPPARARRRVCREGAPHRRVDADSSELLPELVPALKPRLRQETGRRLAYHAPCTLQHGQQLRGHVEERLPSWASRSRCRRRATCAAARPAPIRCCSPNWRTGCATASSATSRACNRARSCRPDIGCIQHLQSGTTTPVRHWVEVLDQALSG